MNYRYAQTDGSNKVMSLFTSTKLEDSAALILLSEGQTPQLGATYDSSQGTFTAPPAPPSGSPDYPMVSKTQFRALLTPAQKLVWDNYDLLKTTLGLSDEQFMAMRSFRADFELVEGSVDLSVPLMIGGMQTISSWDLQFQGGAIFPASEVTRILNGEEVS